MKVQVRFNPERVAPVLRRLISPTRIRARLFDADANLLLDSRHLYSRGQVLRYDLPPVDNDSSSFTDWITRLFNTILPPGNLPVYREAPGGDGSIYPEVMNALTGVRGAVVRVTDQGELIVSVAVPVQRSRAVLGVLLLSTQAGDIDKIVHAERLAILRVFGFDANNVSAVSGHDEVRGTVDLLHSEGEMVKGDRDMLSGILAMQDLEVSDIMVHRTKMTMIDGADSRMSLMKRVTLPSHPF
mgnify:CR=1 FL=1